jgi:hypothetical protein
MANVDEVVTRAVLETVVGEAEERIKAELTKYATKAELKAELANYATRADLKAELANYATKTDLAAWTAKIYELHAESDAKMKQALDDTNTNMARMIDAAYEKWRYDVRVVDDRITSVDDRVRERDTSVAEIRAILDGHVADKTIHRKPPARRPRRPRRRT